jgi:uncharacterized protein YlxW (UPF0749 family)
MSGCECYQVGGRFIAEDPDCPAHGVEAQRMAAIREHEENSLKAEVLRLQNEVSELEGRLETLEDTVREANSRLNSLEDKTI